MRIVIFCHSLLSDWNHGNAHFLRGIADELQRRCHELRIFEPRRGWSLDNLIAEAGEDALPPFRRTYPALQSEFYEAATLDLDEALDGARLVLVHEWSDPLLVRRLAAHRHAGGRYRLLFHDTHHRALTEPAAMARFALEDFDGVLAFGAVLREIYDARGWGRRAWTWHEAADVVRFRPLAAAREGDLVWIGNWGDEERTHELHEFLLAPVRALQLEAVAHGVRYPAQGLAALAAAGIRFAGYLPNIRVPEVFARYCLTVHVPRRPYAAALRGVPTIRIFEALACGMPLVTAPWDDSENLFAPGEDFLMARDGMEMQRHLRRLINEPETAAALAEHGRRTILARHTCEHRADELMSICRELGIAEATAEGERACAAE